MKVWDWAGIDLATPGFAVRLANVARYVLRYHVLLTLLNKFGKRDKMRGMISILSLFHNEFIKFSNTGAQILDSICQIII